jgi:hypothetical protein
VTACTQFAETEALLAILEEDEDEALRILDDMLPGERRWLINRLDRLSLLADDTQRCPRCRKFVDLTGCVSRMNFNTGERDNWHRDCLDAQRAEENGAGS